MSAGCEGFPDCFRAARSGTQELEDWTDAEGPRHLVDQDGGVFVHVQPSQDAGRRHRVQVDHPAEAVVAHRQRRGLRERVDLHLVPVVAVQERLDRAGVAVDRGHDGATSRHWIA